MRALPFAVIWACAIYLGEAGVPRQPRSIEEAPWTVIVERDNDVILLGAIVGPDLVVSVSRIINHVDPRILTVRAGSSQIGSGGSTHTITNVLTHPFASNRGYDVGLFTVDPPFELDHTRRIIGINRNASKEGDVTVSTFSDDGVFTLMYETLYLWKPCFDWYLIVQGIDPSVGCMITPDDLGPCYRDLGGGVVLDGKLIGIVFDFPICYEERWPSLFTNFTDPYISMFLEANVP